MAKHSGGGVVIKEITYSKTFKKKYKKLEPPLREKVDKSLKDLLNSPALPGLKFEKLSGIRNPDVYTIHVTRNYKISMEVKGSLAILRNVACHDEIDSKP